MHMSKIAIVQFKASTDKATGIFQRILTIYFEQGCKDGSADLCAFPEYMMFFTPIITDLPKQVG